MRAKALHSTSVTSAPGDSMYHGHRHLAILCGSRYRGRSAHCLGLLATRLVLGEVEFSMHGCPAYL